MVKVRSARSLSFPSYLGIFWWSLREQKEDSFPLLSLQRSDPLPFLGEPAMASALAYWICRGFNHGPFSVRAHEKTSHDIQGKSLQQNFSCSAREVWYVLIKWKRYWSGAGEIPVMMLGGRKKNAFFPFLHYFSFYIKQREISFMFYPLSFVPIQEQRAMQVFPPLPPSKIIT